MMKAKTPKTGKRKTCSEGPAFRGSPLMSYPNERLVRLEISRLALMNRPMVNTRLARIKLRAKLSLQTFCKKAAGRVRIGIKG